MLPTDDYTVSRWDKVLVALFTRGQVTEPSMVYYLMRRRMRRRVLKKRPELLLPIAFGACMLIGSRTGLGEEAVLLGIVWLFVWSIWLGFAPIQLMIRRGELQELLITPIGVTQVLGDLRVLHAKPLFTAFLFWGILAVFTSSRHVPKVVLINLLFQGPPLLYGGIILGSRVALRTLTVERIAAASGSVLRLVFKFVCATVVWVIIPLGVLIYFLQLLAQVSVQVAWIVGAVVELTALIALALQLNRIGELRVVDSISPSSAPADPIDL